MSSSPKSVCEHPVLVGKKDGGNRPLISLKKIEQVDPLSTLQDGRFISSKYILQQGDCMHKLDKRMPTFWFPYTEIAGTKFVFNGQGSSTNSSVEVLA